MLAHGHPPMGLTQGLPGQGALLAERDFGVLLAVVTLLLGVVARSYEGYEGLVPKLVKLLERLRNKDVTPDYAYYGIPSPWLQVRGFKIQRSSWAGLHGGWAGLGGLGGLHACCLRLHSWQAGAVHSGSWCTGARLHAYKALTAGEAAVVVWALQVRMVFCMTSGPPFCSPACM